MRRTLEELKTCIRIREQNAQYFGCIAAGQEHTVGVRTDGTAVVAGGKSQDWCGVAAVFAGENTAGVRADGTVVVSGAISKRRKRSIEEWRNIAALSVGSGYIVGLKADGTVVSDGSDWCNTGEWSDIVAVSAGGFHTVGLKADGTVVAVGRNEEGQCNIGKWRDIVAVSAKRSHTVGLKTYGAVVAVGENEYGQCDVGEWRDIVAVSAGNVHTVGLKADGTVVAVGRNANNQCDVGEWRDIVAVSAGGFHTVGLKADGTIVTVGADGKGQCKEPKAWKDIGRGDIKQLIQQISRRKEGLCVHCGGEISGLLDKKCKSCGRLKRELGKKEKRIRKAILISVSVVAGLVLLMLPYAITKSDGFFRVIAQPSMFISMLLSYLTLGIGGLTGILLVLGGLGNAITGNTFDEKGLAIEILAIVVCAIIFFSLSALLINLEYINPFTGELFAVPFTE